MTSYYFTHPQTVQRTRESPILFIDPSARTKEQHAALAAQQARLHAVFEVRLQLERRHRLALLVALNRRRAVDSACPASRSFCKQSHFDPHVLRLVYAYVNPPSVRLLQDVFAVLKRVSVHNVVGQAERVDEALILAKMAADRGSLDALWVLGMLYTSGLLDHARATPLQSAQRLPLLSSALRAFKQGAERGHALCMFWNQYVRTLLVVRKVYPFPSLSVSGSPRASDLRDRQLALAVRLLQIKAEYYESTLGRRYRSKLCRVIHTHVRKNRSHPHPIQLRAFFFQAVCAALGTAASMGLCEGPVAIDALHHNKCILLSEVFGVEHYTRFFLPVGALRPPRVS